MLLLLYASPAEVNAIRVGSSGQRSGGLRYGDHGRKKKSEKGGYEEQRMQCVTSTKFKYEHTNPLKMFVARPKTEFGKWSLQN
jgi:hypothetical protein